MCTRSRVRLLGTDHRAGSVGHRGRERRRRGYDYRETISPWFRSLFYLQPDPDLMTGAPILFRLQAISALLQR
ncbi:respiratory nitrate reductase subunit gamma [Streptomyces sp. AK04-3B]|uniref:respiratory nitrate reductase subunit gamma n=1 Tax=unclassified Streptomyces TaxID=2593676 RepID=UPI0039F46F87